jgi:hypothetical protein
MSGTRCAKLQVSLYESFWVKMYIIIWAIINRYIARSILMFQGTVRYQFLYTTLTLTPISDLHYSFVILFWDAKNCAYRTDDVILFISVT